MKKYGIPYQGSKNFLLTRLGAILPKADKLYDLFGGGFSVSHYMFESGKYKTVHYNEIKSDVASLVKDAISGKYNYDIFKPKWISRDDFARDKDSCAYTRVIWSFGNNQKNYLFNKDTENKKKSLHNAIIFDRFDQQAKDILKTTSWPGGWSITKRRIYCRRKVAERKGELQQLEQLQQLQHLEQLERLQQLERLEQLEISNISYDKVEIGDGDCIIYCDPPYKGSLDYLESFDHDKFWQWVGDNDKPVYISEYSAPKNFKTIAAFRKVLRAKLANDGKRKHRTEKIFTNGAGERKLKESNG